MIRLRLNDWIVTNLSGAAPFSRGDVFAFPQAFRDRIMQGELASSPWDSQLTLEESTANSNADFDHAIIGAPVTVGGALYGALCGLDASSTVAIAEPAFRGVAAAARILSTILRRDWDAEELLRRAERAEIEALVDEMTGLFNRRGWDRLVEREEKRSARYGHGATIAVMDLDGLKRTNDLQGHAAGDALLRDVANVLRSVIREHDVAARIGGDEFALLVVESDDPATKLLERLEAAFAAEGIEVSIGCAHRKSEGGIQAAIDRADAAMYERKFARSAS